METLAIKLYFYSWEIGGERYNSALYASKQERDGALKLTQDNLMLRGIKFMPAETELFKTDLNAIIKAFNK